MKKITRVDYNFRVVRDDIHQMEKFDTISIGGFSKVVDIQEVIGGTTKPYHIKALYQDGSEIEIFRINKIYRK